MKVPEVLLNGNHAEIDKWRRQKALEKTRLIRKDLLEGANGESE
jgi:tRNA (guanine37-N1)-methyltransferase